MSTRLPARLGQYDSAAFYTLRDEVTEHLTFNGLSPDHLLPFFVVSNGKTRNGKRIPIGD